MGHRDRDVLLHAPVRAARPRGGARAGRPAHGDLDRSLHGSPRRVAHRGRGGEQGGADERHQDQHVRAGGTDQQGAVGPAEHHHPHGRRGRRHPTVGRGDGEDFARGERPQEADPTPLTVPGQDALHQRVPGQDREAVRLHHHGVPQDVRGGSTGERRHHVPDPRAHHLGRRPGRHGGDHHLLQGWQVRLQDLLQDLRGRDRRDPRTLRAHQRARVAPGWPLVHVGWRGWLRPHPPLRQRLLPHQVMHVSREVRRRREENY